MQWKQSALALSLALSGGIGMALTSTALAGGPVSGDPNDIYVTSDTANEIYQFQRTSPWAHVPGSYPGSLGGTYSQVFSNQSQIGAIGTYLGAVAGPNQNFFIGGLGGGLTEIDSSTGTAVQTVATGPRAGPAKAPNGNIMVGGPTGIEEFNSTTGAFVRTVSAVGDGYNLLTHRGNEIFTSNWVGGAAFGIKRRDWITGLPTGPDIATPFWAQEIGFGPDGALYATALYEGPGVEGLWRYDFTLGSWSHYIDTTSLAGTGPHGFTFDPANFDIYLAFQTGELYRFDVSGAYLNQIAFVPTKLTDVLFKTVVPEPSAFALLAVAGLWALRRR